MANINKKVMRNWYKKIVKVFIVVSLTSNEPINCKVHVEAN